MVILDDRPWYVRALDGLDSRGLASALLAPLGAMTVLCVRLARRLRADRPLPAPPATIGIGNLRVGGTGKTPVVEDLARRWQARGRRVAVVTRGYRSRGDDDEPGWLRERGLPTHVGSDRASAVGEARRSGAEVVFLDDALQSRHRPQLTAAIVLEKDLHRLPRALPAGPAREGVEGLRRAQALLVRVESEHWPVEPARCIAHARRAQQLCGGPAFVFRSRAVGLVDAKGQEVGLDSGRPPVLLVSGLARPASFESDARGFGLPIVGAVRLEDHARFDERQVARIHAMRERLGASVLVCPQKNARRLWRAAGTSGVLALRAEIEWGEADPLDFLQASLLGK